MGKSHPEYLNAERWRDRDLDRAFYKIFLPGIVVWVLAVVLTFLIPGPADVYFVGLLVTFLGIAVVAGVYAYGATRADEQALSALQRKCRICGEEMAGNQIAGHLKAVHPDEVKYLREARAYALGTLTGVTAVMLYLAVLTVPQLHYFWGVRSLGRSLAVGGFLLWAAALYVWRRFVDSRHIARVRRVWQHTHRGSGG